MAISFKTDSSYGYNLLSLFDVKLSLIAEAKKYGVMVEQTSPGTFVVVAPDGTSCGVISVKGPAISLAKAGTLGPASKQGFQFQFEAALIKAITLAEVVNNKKAVKAPDGPVFDGPETTDGLPNDALPKSSVKIDVDAAALSSFLSVSEDFKVKLKTPKGSGKALKLENATAVLQPVLGTSSGSVYTVVALFKGLNLATRIKGAVVSFRAEGPAIKKHAAGLASVGFSLKDSHASVHFNITDSALREKTLGAICGAIGLTNLIDGATMKEVPQ